MLQFKFNKYLNVKYTIIFKYKEDKYMTLYYVEQLKNNKNQTIGFSEIKQAKERTSVPEDAIEVNMNGIKYEDFVKNPKNYYLSGTKLVEIKR